jgi:hypothetical protein
MAILLILPPALSYAQQSDADFIRSLDGVSYYRINSYGDGDCIFINGTQAIKKTEIDRKALRYPETFPIVGRSILISCPPEHKCSARITERAIVEDFRNGSGEEHTEILNRDDGGQCGWAH